MTIIYGISDKRLSNPPTFEELIDYEEPKINRPDKSATISRHNHT